MKEIGWYCRMSKTRIIRMLFGFTTCVLKNVSLFLNKIDKKVVAVWTPAKILVITICTLKLYFLLDSCVLGLFIFTDVSYFRTLRTTFALDLKLKIIKIHIWGLCSFNYFFILRGGSRCDVDGFVDSTYSTAVYYPHLGLWTERYDP